MAKPSRTTAIKGVRQPRPGIRAPAPALAEQAWAQLENLIVTLELPPGSIWSESQLSLKLGIGRSPVREALKRLQAEYLLKILPRFGVQITEINVTQQQQLLEARRVLERLIAERAARRATPEERMQLMQTADTLDALVDVDLPQYLRLVYDSKKFVAACARSPFAESAITPLYAMSRRFYYLHYRRAHDLPVAAGQHAQVFRAIASGDETAAGDAADSLMDYVEELTRATVTQRL